MERIISSLADTDLYKITMAQAVFHQYPHLQVQYEFKCRPPKTNKAPTFLRQHISLNELREQIDAFCQLKFTEAELNYLKGLRYIKPDFIDFLALYKPNPNHIKVEHDANSFGGIKITVTGSWLHTIFFEVPILAIVNEMYFKGLSASYPENNYLAIGKSNLHMKLAMVKKLNDDGFKISEFGTRRRFSKLWQENVLDTMLEEIPNNIVGTSNVFLAMTRNIMVQGTMAHEFIMAHQGLDTIRLIKHQHQAFEAWVKEYRGDLGIVLTDTIGLKPFLNDFDLYFAKLFDGVRHDSGDPYVFGEAIIEHYKKLGIDPMTKSIIFSDGLNISKAISIYDTFKDRINVRFGIGTDLTNHVGYEALNIVMKMTMCNGQALAKISDEPRKAICNDPEFLKYLKSVFGVE